MKLNVKNIILGLVLILGIAEGIILPINNKQIYFPLRRSKGELDLEEEIITALGNIGVKNKKESERIASQVASKIDLEFQKDLVVQLVEYPKFYKFLYNKSGNVDSFMNEVLFILTKLEGFKRALQFRGKNGEDKKVVLDIGCGRMEYIAALDDVFRPEKIIGVDILGDRTKFAQALAKILGKSNSSRKYQVLHKNIIDLDTSLPGLKADVILMLYPMFFGYGVQNPSLAEYFKEIDKVLKDGGFVIFGAPAADKKRYQKYIEAFKSGSTQYKEYEIPIHYVSGVESGSYYFLTFDKGGIKYIAQSLK